MDLHRKKWRDDGGRKSTSELNGSKWKEGSEGNADDGFKGKTEEATSEENMEGGEATAEETADGEKASPTEDPSEETTAKKTERVKWWNERRTGEMTDS
jgi:hypothetical protein